MRNSGEVKTVFWSQARDTKVVAYCHKYNRYITAQQMKTKGCIQKDCEYLEKLDCQYWRERANKKKRKALKVELGIPSYCKVRVKGDQIDILV